MEKGQVLYEGKAKKVYATENPDLVIVSYKDDATAFNGLKKGTIAGKGTANNRISNHFFQLLEREGIPTHYEEELNDRETLVKRVQIIPVEVIVRNIVAGSLVKRLGLPEGIVLSRPVLEYCYKNDALGDPMINASHIYAIGLADESEMNRIAALSVQITEVLRAYLKAAGLDLIDIKLEFGRFQGEILLADEISPDTCRFWDSSTGKKLDKDRFRMDLGDVEGAYGEILQRLLG